MAKYLIINGQAFIPDGVPGIVVSTLPSPGQTLQSITESTAGWVDVVSSPPGGVTYQEGGVASGNVFATFATALAVIQLNGTPMTMFIDGSLGQPFVPAGTYDL